MKYSKLNSTHHNDDDVSAIEMGTMDHSNNMEQDSTNLLSSYNTYNNTTTQQPLSSSSSSSKNTVSHIQDSDIVMDNGLDFDIDSDDDDLNDSTTLTHFSNLNKQILKMAQI
ncbi:unnamed protein product [[Candida] boidinii]|nr:unnamed protein product [[Candida] boidinii]